MGSSKEYERKVAVRRTIQELKRFIDGANNLKATYIEKAKDAKAKNSYATYQIARSGLKATLTQLARAEEMLTNLELVNQYANFAKMSGGFVKGMSAVSKELSKAAASADFEKATKLFNTAMKKTDLSSNKMRDYLNNTSDTFASTDSVSDMLDSEIDMLIGSEIISVESEIDAKIAALKNEPQVQIKEPKKVVAYESAQEVSSTRKQQEPVNREPKPARQEPHQETSSQEQVNKENNEPKPIPQEPSTKEQSVPPAKQGPSFEPKTLGEFIGQAKTVKALKDAIAEAKMDGKKCIADKGGVLFLGGKGLGKTTLMQLTANELGVRCEFFDASSMKNDVASRRSFDLFLERVAKEGKPVVIAVDEIHALPTDIQSRLLTLLQSRIYSNLVNGDTINIPMPEFTFIAATTDEHDILETVYDRFNKGLICQLEDYTTQELKYIVEGKFAYFGLRVTDEAKTQIVMRGRSSLREIESFILKLRQKARLSDKNEVDETMTNELFEELGIDKNGLNAQDITILKALESSSNYTLAEENLVSKVNIKLENYQKFRKPYLIRCGYIVSSSKGQTLTEEAILLLKKRGEEK